MDDTSFLKNIINLFSDITWEVDSNWVFRNIAGNTRKYGFYPADIIGKRPFDFMNSDCAREFAQQLNSIAAKKENIKELKALFITDNGAEIFFTIYGMPVTGNRGALLGYRGIAKDITVKKVNNTYARVLTRDINNKKGLGEQRFRKMLESAPQGIAVADHNGFIIHANKAWKKMFGFTKSDLKNLHMNHFRSDENKQHDTKLYDSLMKNKIRSYRIERRFIKKDKKTFWCDLTVRLVDDPESPYPYAIGLYVDITDRKILEDDLKSSEEFTRILISESPFGIGVISDGKLVFANKAFSSMFGFNDPFDMTGIGISSLVTKTDARKFLTKNGKEKIPIRNNTIIELRAVKKNGTRFTVSCKFELLNIKNSPVLIVFTEDITDRKKSEERLKRFSDDLEKLVEERTNEIKKLNRQIFKTQEDERQRIARDLHDGVGQTMLAAKLAFSSSIRAKSGIKKQRLNHGMLLMDRASQELREVYTGLYPSILRELGLGDTINWFIRNSLAAAGIKVVYNNKITGPVPDFISINIYRIMQELFNNIIKHSQADYVEINIVEKPDFIISVTDNGIGFNIEKTGQKGKGAGLTNIKQRVEYMDGKIYISSRPGNTTVVIIIPGENR